MIRRSLNRLVNWAQNYGIQSCQTILVDNDASRISASGMNFTMHRADGGYIIEYREYDRVKDQINNRLHIITEDANLGERIGQIITLELLRN